MTARKIFTLVAGAMTALVLTLPATAAAQGFTDQRSAASHQYDHPDPPPPHGGTPPGQGGTPPGQEKPKPPKPKPDKKQKKGAGNVQGDANSKKKGDSGSGVAGAGGGGGPGAGVLGADTTGSLERSGSLPFTGLEIWMLLALGLTALAAGFATRRASRGPLT